MSRWRPSNRPYNVKRRLANRAAQVIAALVIAGGYYVWNTYIAPADGSSGSYIAHPAAQAPKDATPDAAAGAGRVEELMAARRSGEMVTLSASVARVLRDDNDGSPHQKFILRLPSGHRVLVAHNTGLAPRVPGLAAGETVTVRGEYEWDERGGVIHWTHHDPAARHQPGWIEFRGKKYE